MTLENFIRQYLPNYQERKNNLYRIHRDKPYTQWLVDKYAESFLNFCKINNLNLDENE